MTTTEEVQDQLYKFLKEPDSTEKDHVPIQPFPEMWPSDDARRELLKAPGERVVSKTIRFNSWKELWRKIFG